MPAANKQGRIETEDQTGDISAQATEYRGRTSNFRYRTKAARNIVRKAGDRQPFRIAEDCETYMENDNPNLDNGPTLLPPAIRRLLDEMRLVPGGLCRRLLVRSAELSLRKADDAGEVSCTGVFFTSLTFSRCLQELSNVIQPSIDESDGRDLSTLRRLVEELQKDKDKWQRLHDLALSYYGSTNSTSASPSPKHRPRRPEWHFAKGSSFGDGYRRRPAG